MVTIQDGPAQFERGATNLVQGCLIVQGVEV